MQDMERCERHFPSPYTPLRPPSSNPPNALHELILYHQLKNLAAEAGWLAGRAVPLSCLVSLMYDSITIPHRAASPS